MFFTKLACRIALVHLSGNCSVLPVQVFCTVSGAGSDAVLATSKNFDAVLVDEAAQLVEAEACILLAVRNIPRQVASISTSLSLNEALDDHVQMWVWGSTEP